MQNRQPFNFKNNRNNIPVAQVPPVSFSSGMTSEQKYQSIVESVQISLAGRPDQSTKGCQMHPKASQKCRKCQAILEEAVKARLSGNKQGNDLNQVCVKEQFWVMDQIEQQIKLNSENPKNHLNQKLQSNIVGSGKYKSLRELKSVKEVLGQLSHEQIPISAYRAGTNQDPTEFMITLFRILQLKPTKPQLMIMTKSNNVNVRALALIYIRMALDFQQVYAWLKASFGDNKLINAMMTVGELAEKLISEEGMDVGGIRMPRIPTKIQKAIDKKFASQKNFKNQEQKIIQQKIGEQKIPKAREQRSRSRERKRKRSESLSSSSSSSSSSSRSSSSSSSSSNSQEVKQNVEPPKIQPPLPEKKPKTEQAQTSSLTEIRMRIQQSMREKEQKEKKKKLLEEKYQAQEKIQNEDQNNEYSQESDSVEKFQMN